MADILAVKGGPAVTQDPFPSWPIYGEEEKEGLLRVLNSGKWGLTIGNEVRGFERRFSVLHSAQHGIATTNGTTALSIALRSAGIGPGDEVILPSYTFIASATAVLDALAKPVFVDIEPESYNINPDGVRQVLSSRTKAILPVHFGGRPADMDPLLALARERDLWIIEDACQAWSATYRGRPVGTLGNAGCFSFQSSKNISCGEGGMILTNDFEIATKARSISNCGRREDGIWYEHYEYGGNSRLTEFQGALLHAQLDRYPSQHEQRENAARYLNRGIQDLDGYINLGPLEEGSRSSWHIFIFRLETDAWGGVPKEKIAEAVRAEGIPVSAGYSLPVYGQPMFTEGNFGARGGPTLTFESELPDFRRFSLPNVEKACKEEALWLTQSTLLAPEEMLRKVLDALEKVFRGRDQLG